jgi:16S rRNA (guanine966-N2)-methyltransferase
VRIIAGEFRGRRIEAPAGLATRPMLDRVREAVFSTLQPWLRDAVVLDLFAGSGSLGLEALSRGARTVRFVERGAPALATLRKNVEALRMRSRVEVVVGDALNPSSWLPSVDVALLDPPYASIEKSRARVLGALATLVESRLADEGIAVLHVPRGALAAEDLAPARARVRRYGTNDVWYVERAAGE